MWKSKVRRLPQSFLQSREEKKRYNHSFLSSWGRAAAFERIIHDRPNLAQDVKSTKFTLNTTRKEGTTLWSLICFVSGLTGRRKSSGMKVKQVDLSSPKRQRTRTRKGKTTHKAGRTQNVRPRWDFFSSCILTFSVIQFYVWCCCWCCLARYFHFWVASLKRHFLSFKTIWVRKSVL